MIYFDNAATTFPKPVCVGNAVLDAMQTMGNPGRGAHGMSLHAARIVYDTREKLTLLFGAKNPERIAFTQNATEALNIAVFGMLQPGDHVITTVCEHNSVLRPLYMLEKQGIEVSYLQADKKGNINYEAMDAAYRSNTKAVIITHASNVTGNITDINRVSSFVKSHHLILTVDASQSAGILPINVSTMGIDILCFAGHKGLLGPQGTGGIYVKEGIRLRPLVVGGSGIHSYDREHPAQMPASLEAGTLNGHGIAGLHAALSYIENNGREAIYNTGLALARRFYEGVKEIPGIILYGDFEKPHVPIVTLNVGEYDSASISDTLWEEYEIAVRGGAHCAPLMHKALGTGKQGAVRFSFSHFNTRDEVDKAIEALRELAEDL